MAQQGGTWNPKKNTRQDIALAKKKENNSQSPQEQTSVDDFDTSYSENNKTTGQDWEIVKDPKIDPNPEPEPESHRGGFSSQFNLQVGWGKWRTNVFNWDINVRKAARQTEEVTPLSSSSSRKESKGMPPAE